MNFHEFDKPVINLHELSNGLIKYYNPAHQREVLGKPYDKPWGNYQSLDTIAQMLHSTDHYKTARLAHYHIQRRADSLDQQIPFYNYLNENFFIIQTRRKNLLEHALSWCIFNETKRHNEYTHAGKVQTLGALYRDRITVDTGIMIDYLFKYKSYLEWVDRHFVVSSHFEYEQHLPEIEKYILNLGVFRGQPKKINWSDHYGIDFQQWNRCHYLLSDLSGISQQLSAPNQQLQLEYNTSSTADIQLQSVAQSDIATSLSSADQQYLLVHGTNYKKVVNDIENLVTQKVLPASIPIKLNTLLEKKLLIKNWNECVQVYNQWMTNPLSEICGLADLCSDLEVDQQIEKEINHWHSWAQLN
jgi:hypothetical protein